MDFTVTDSGLPAFPQGSRTKGDQPAAGAAAICFVVIDSGHWNSKACAGIATSKARTGSLIFRSRAAQDLLDVRVPARVSVLERVRSRLRASGEEEFNHLRLAPSRREADRGPATAIHVHARVERSE